MNGRLRWSEGPDEIADALRRLVRAGATRVSVKTMGAGLESVDDHCVACVADVVKVLDL
jgi:hypothetical protein